MKKKIYSFALYDWVRDQLPEEIKQAFYDTGWNALGIYELVKEGLKKEKSNGLIHPMPKDRQG